MLGLESTGSAAALGLTGLVWRGWGHPAASTKQLAPEEGCVCTDSVLVSSGYYAAKYLGWGMVFLYITALPSPEPLHLKSSVSGVFGSK